MRAYYYCFTLLAEIYNKNQLKVIESLGMDKLTLLGQALKLKEGS